jgi:Tol biopolymer transport system component
MDQRIFTRLFSSKGYSRLGIWNLIFYIFILMGNFRVKISGTLLQLLTLFIFSYAASAQSSSEKKKIFTKAENYFLYEEYKLANQLYLELETPDNLNIKYKIGTCYLNISGEKEKSIPYLEEAIKDASYDSRTESYKEKRAPLDSYFSLAKAYIINKDFDKGLETLLTFNKLLQETRDKGGMKNSDYIDQQIQACKNAIELMKTPVLFSKRQMDGNFSRCTVNDNPAVSFDGNTIVYTERRGSINSILYSKKIKGKWQPPVDITAELNAGEDCASCSLNNDGTQLFLYKTGNYDGEIYSSNYAGGVWKPIKRLNGNINTRFYESHASVSADGKKLYFTSNREGGAGNLDIYISEKDESGDWGSAVNLGTVINTPFNEETPFITENDSVLYFSSEGHNSMGGFDIFKSHRNKDAWRIPTNIGYPINSSDDDLFFQPFNNEKNGYYTITTGYKKRDIFFLGLGGPDVNKLSEINGKLSLSDTILTFDDSFKIHLIDRESGDTLDVAYPNKLTGLYSFYATNGKYRIVYTGQGYFNNTIDTTIYQDNLNQPLNLDVTLLRDLSQRRGDYVYARINLSEIPKVEEIDPSILIKNLNVNDINDEKIKDSDILYYTVQVMALYNPVDVSYFKYINDIRVMYNELDKFYRYTTGTFQTKEEAYALKAELIRKGYPDDLFIKKVSK